ncbi:3-oxo-5-alpha-steroid 4-dehydrogenase 2a isoform X1 [Erpetoichthys calabaricus]|uniref:3-oxo-5-alpha-steroid 4-dehydrogenase 2a isoform X1 n=1 Tax=Erpetoichthys calabaricus TaxID=27687 RepID=UPI0010A0ABEF|nr:3-oxo-5-alpha-steroid 4-dehydrogenase 2a isoform X1 [Erpetoichthys calabaricus]
MQCCEGLVFTYAMALAFAGVLFCYRQVFVRNAFSYGRYRKTMAGGTELGAKVAWFIQELPAFLAPVLLCCNKMTPSPVAAKMLLGMYCGHYFQRTFIYSPLTRGQHSPLEIVIAAIIFCTMNGFFQGHYLLHCAIYSDAWLTDIRFILGLIIFLLGMAVNIHSDHILRNLRTPGEISYKIPRGGLFELVSGANFLGEIVEWFGYALASWSLPAFSFAFFTLCSIGPRAYHHHRYYLEKFEDYPRSRKALIPFVF